MKSATVQQERMSLTFTKKDTWIKNEIEREIELNPYWSKTGYVKNALIEHFRNKKNGSNRTNSFS